MQLFAAQGSLVDISDVWDDIGGQYSESYKIASTGLDGTVLRASELVPMGLTCKSMMAEIGLKTQKTFTTGMTSWPHLKS